MTQSKSRAAMDTAVVMDGAVAADAGIITGGAEVVAITMVGDIIVITGDLVPISSKGSARLAASFFSLRKHVTC